jgi:PAS domain S-box-containing protein
LIVVRYPGRPDERQAVASFIPNGGRGDIMAETERPDDLQAELQRLRRRVAELEAARQPAAPPPAPPSRPRVPEALAGPASDSDGAAFSGKPDVIGYGSVGPRPPGQVPARTLRATAERYSLIATGTGAGVWDMHFLRRRGYLSPRWKEIVGYAGDDAFAGQAVLEERLHPEDRERYAATRRDHLERRRPFSVEVRIEDGQGGYRWIHVIAQAQWDREGRPVRLVGSLCDVTARKLAEMTVGERQRAQGRLEGVTLTAREISHHLNNELAVVSWALELVQQVDDLPGELRPWLDSASQELAAAARHLAQLQQVVRVATKETPVGLALDLERSVDTDAAPNR